LSAKPVRFRAVPKVYFLNEQVEVDVPEGTTVLGAADRAGVNVHRGFWSRLHCRGLGLCGSCKVWVTPPDGLKPVGWRERIRYTIRGTLRLGCVAQVTGDVEVRTKPAGPEPDRTLTAYRTNEPPRSPRPPPPKPKPDPKEAAPAAAKPAAPAAPAAAKPAAPAAPAAPATPQASAPAAAKPAAPAAPKPDAQAAPKPDAAPESKPDTNTP